MNPDEEATALPAVIEPTVPTVVPVGVAAGHAWLMQPQSFKEAKEIAELLAKSSFVPDAYKNRPGDVLAAIQYGVEIGLPALQALNGIAVINGHPCVYGDTAMAVIESAATPSGQKLLVAKDEFFELDGVRLPGFPAYDDRKKIPDGLTAVCVMWRLGRPQPCRRTFSVADARRAKAKEGGQSITLWDKSTYQQYPQRMLAMRARAWCQRDEFPDALKGLAIREEAEDIDAPVRQVTQPQPTDGDGYDRTGRTRPEEAAPSSGDLDPDAIITETQRRRLFAECSKSKKHHDDLKAWLATEGVETTTQIPNRLFEKALEWAKQPPQGREGTGSAERTPGDEG